MLWPFNLRKTRAVDSALTGRKIPENDVEAQLNLGLMYVNGEGVWHAEEGRSLQAGKHRPACHLFFLQCDVWRT